MSRSLLCLLFSILQFSFICAQPEDGRIYRLINKYYPTLAATEDISTNGIVTRERGGKDAFEQMWRFYANGTGFTLTNVLTENVISNYGGESSQYWTSANGDAHTFQVAAQTGDYWNVRHNTGMGGLHAAWTGKVVYWWDNAADATQWKLEEITGLSEEQLSLKQLIYKNYVDLTSHEAEYNKALKQFFTDESCSELLPAYASLSDEELSKAMSDLPEEFLRIAIKVKNNAWGHREREFRIRSYEAYSDPDVWYKELKITRPGRINNPTGIYGNKGDVILVFVGDEIPQGATLGLEYIHGTDVEGSAVSLHRGLNVLTVAADELAFYIKYIGTTSLADSRLITDYPPIRIHIENGTVNGYWDIRDHNDEDWKDILKNATAHALDVKGKHVQFHMHTSVFHQQCPNGIHEALDWWEDMVGWEEAIMGLEGIVPEKCNNMACAITLDDDHTYMAATWYRTQYHVNVMWKILNFSTVVQDPDYCFGPAHENGHMRQGAINIAGCTESSNGVLENLVVWKIGKYLTRGPANTSIYNEYAADVPWINRANDDMLRLQWQLYLYFHELGIDPTFWPRVFQAMRETPLPIRWGDKKEVSAKDDMLLFARVCCDVAQMDFTDFFRVYGYLVPHEKLETRESGTFITTPQKDIDAFITYAAKYPKAPPIEFLDDRTRPIPRTDGGSGNRLTYDYGPGQCGDVGLYTDFLRTDVKAEGYLYSRSGNSITLKNGTGAVGFRIYNKESGELAYLTNCLRFTLPASCQAIGFDIVAVQADGTEVRVPSTAEAGTEEEQLAALKASLTTVQSTLDLRDFGETVGYFYDYALRDLEALYEQALVAYGSKDQTVHTYGEWAMLLDEALQAVRSDDEARVPVWTENSYALYLATYRNYSLYYFTSGPKGNMLEPAENETKQWQFVPVGDDGRYAIRNVSNGLYITTLAADRRAKMESDKLTDAVQFEVRWNEKGLITFAVPTTGLYLSYNSDKEAIGSATASLWRVATVIDNHTEAERTRAESVLRLAQYMEEETGDATCIVLAESYEKMLTEFLESKARTIDVFEGRQPGRLDRALDELWATMEALSPTYCLTCIPTNAIREPDNKPQLMLAGEHYYLQNLRTGTYAYYNDQEGRYEGCLRMAPLTVPDDTRYYFQIERDTEGRYYLRSSHSGYLAGAWGSYVDVTGRRDIIPFAISFDEEAGGLVFTTGEEYLSAQTMEGGYAQIRAKGMPWKLRQADNIFGGGIASRYDNEGMGETVLYDLTGRPATSPKRGIYIRRDGRKIVIK